MPSMSLLSVLLIPYTTLAYVIHAGDILPGTNKQLRLALCAIPFGLASYLAGDISIALIASVMAYIGTNIGPENFWLMGNGTPEFRSNIVTRIVEALKLKFPTLPYCIAGMAIKGFVTNPLFGWFLCPLAYYISSRAPKVSFDLGSLILGVFYGVALYLVAR
jgi:hypothetical protein